jgi:hypothetical protein
MEIAYGLVKMQCFAPKLLLKFDAQGGVEAEYQKRAYQRGSEAGLDRPALYFCDYAARLV